MTQSKTGATKVKMRADHYYMLHRYQEAFDIAQEFCELVRTSGNLSVSQGQNDGGFRRTDAAAGATTDAGVLKVSDPKEMQEMSLRCALKLSLFDVAASLADELVTIFFFFFGNMGPINSGVVCWGKNKARCIIDTDFLCTLWVTCSCR